MTDENSLRSQLLIRVEQVQTLKNEVKLSEDQLKQSSELLTMRELELSKKNNEIARLREDVNKYRDVLNVILKNNDVKLPRLSIMDPSKLPPEVSELQLEEKRMKKEGVSAESSASKNQSLKLYRESKDFNTKKLITQAIRNNDFLQHLQKEQIEEIVDCMQSRNFKSGDIIVKEGAVGVHFYVLAEGEVEVTKNGKTRGKMSSGKAFGELAILYNCPRTATITSISTSKVWALERRTFQQIMMQTNMIKHNAKLGFLKTVHFLQKLDDNSLMKLADTLEDELFQEGEYIIREGTLGETFFIISEGRVVVDQDGTEIRSLSAGEFFGEIAIMVNTPHERIRTANVKSLSNVSCLTLDREHFLTLIGDLSEIKDKKYSPRQVERDTSISETFRNVKLSDLLFIQTLGLGGFGRVELVEIKGTKKTYAMKCLSKVHIVETRQQEHIFNEKQIMLQAKSQFICELHCTFRDNRYLYMLLEVCLGGEVWTLLRDRGSFNDPLSKFIVGCVVEALEYLHYGGIIYRDLKPENLLFDKEGYVKLTDFGFAKYIGFGGCKTWTFCGTPEYVAPEIILNRGHDYASDYWSLGILIYELMTGIPPFQANDAIKTYNMILRGIDSINFPPKISKNANHIIRRLCKENPAERIGYQKHRLKDIRVHRWFQGFDWGGLLNRQLTPPYKPNVTSNHDTSNFDEPPPSQDPREVSEDLTGWDKEF